MCHASKKCRNPSLLPADGARKSHTKLPTLFERRPQPTDGGIARATPERCRQPTEKSMRAFMGGGNLMQCLAEGGTQTTKMTSIDERVPPAVVLSANRACVKATDNLLIVVLRETRLATAAFLRRPPRSVQFPSELRLTRRTIKHPTETCI